jgi:hypothetical protein
MGFTTVLLRFRNSTGYENQEDIAGKGVGWYALVDDFRTVDLSVLPILASGGELFGSQSPL